jgi:ketosteroid isomerase-like protein
MSPSAPPSISDQFRAYIKAFNSHSFDDFSRYWADDIFVHLPACPPLQGKDAIRQLLEQGLSFFRETIHPTFVVEGQKSLAMEAKVDTEMLQDMPLPFPFTGKTHAKGDKFVYSSM